MNLWTWLFEHAVTVRYWVVLVAFLIGCLYAYYDGWVDGLHFDRPASLHQILPAGLDIHQLFVMRRAIVLILLSAATGILPAIAFGLVFPYIHDGRYYFTRNQLNHQKYPDGWKSEPSRSSTAVMDFSYRVRVLFAFFGVLLTVFSVIVAINRG